MGFNLYLREIIFLTNVAVLTIELKSSCLNPWISFDVIEIREKGMSA